MIADEIQIRPRYGEVDQMGYVYHANYVSYCHHARNEFLRKHGISESSLEGMNIILPVISFEIKYKKPAFYDELLTIKTKIHDIPNVRLNFDFEIWNGNNILITTAKTTIVFMNKKSRNPIPIPEFIKQKIIIEALTP